MNEFHGPLNNRSETLEVLIKEIQKNKKIIIYSQKINLFVTLLKQWFPYSFTLRFLGANETFEVFNPQNYLKSYLSLSVNNYWCTLKPFMKYFLYSCVFKM